MEQMPVSLNTEHCPSPFNSISRAAVVVYALAPKGIEMNTEINYIIMLLPNVDVVSADTAAGRFRFVH